MLTIGIRVCCKWAKPGFVFEARFLVLLRDAAHLFSSPSVSPCADSLSYCVFWKTHEYFADESGGTSGAAPVNSNSAVPIRFRLPVDSLGVT